MKNWLQARIQVSAGTNSFTFVFSGSTGITFSISLASSQLSRNSLKIYKSCRVFLQVSSFSCCSENAFTSSLLITTNIGVVIAPNRVHFAKFTEAEIVRSSLNIITRVTYKKYATRFPDVVIVLIPRVSLFPVKHSRP